MFLYPLSLLRITFLSLFFRVITKLYAWTLMPFIKSFRSFACPCEQHFSQNVLELQFLGEKQVTASRVQHSSFLPFGIESAFRLFFAENKDQCLFINVVHSPTQCTLLSLLEGASQRLSCRAVKKKKNQVPQSQGKLKCHSLQGVLGGRISIYFNTDHPFYGLVQKLSKSILNLFFIAFISPQLHPFFLL